MVGSWALRLGIAALVPAWALIGCNRSPQVTPQAAATTQPVFAAVDVGPVYHGPLVELRGTPEQIGEEHARRLASQIQLLHKQYLDVYLGTGVQRFLALTAAK